MTLLSDDTYGEDEEEEEDEEEGEEEEEGEDKVKNCAGEDFLYILYVILVT